MSAFLSFDGFDLSAGPDLFNQTLSGGKMMAPGIHDVTISALEADAKAKKFKVTFQNADQQTLFDHIYIEKYQDPSKLNVQFTTFLLAVCGTNSRAMDFLKNLSKKPHLIQALTGLKLQITVVESQRGYTVKTEGHAHHIVDAGDGLCTEIIADKVPSEGFINYQALGEWVKAYNASVEKHLALYRAYPKVKNYTRSESGVEDNVKHLQAAIEATPATAAAPRPSLASDLGIPF